MLFSLCLLFLCFIPRLHRCPKQETVQDLHPINALRVCSFIVSGPGVTRLVRKAECLAFLIYMALLSDSNIYIPYIMQMSFLLTSHYFSESSPPKVTIFVSNVVQADNVM